MKKRIIKKRQNINLENILKYIFDFILVSLILYMILTILLPYIINIKNNFFLDIGSKRENKSADIGLLTPAERLSEPTGDKPDYRKLKDPLIYSTIKILHKTNKIEIRVRFKDNFPVDSKGFYIGAQYKEGWNYTYQSIYLPYLKPPENTKYIQENNQMLYFLNNDFPQFNTIEEFLNNIPIDSIISTNFNLKLKPIKIENYATGNLDIRVALRESHSFYFYAKDNIDLIIEKQDINWYENEDDLIIKIYDIEGNIMKEDKIPDDGIKIKSTEQGTPQGKRIKIDDIKEGVYKMDLVSKGDLIIRRIKINQRKLVVNKRVFLADSKVYKLETKPVKLYTKTNKKTDIDFITYHKEGLQDIIINKKSYKISELKKDIKIPMDKSNNLQEIIFTQNDIIISSDNYYAFTKDSYFDPIAYKIVGLENYKIADYLYTDYKEPEKDGEWLIGKTIFDIKDVYVKDGKLSIMLNAKHLGDARYKEYTIPVDWIKATLYRGPK